MCLATVQLLRQSLSASVRSKGFNRLLENLRITDAASGRCSCEFTVAEEHTNRVGRLHGGLTALLVDEVTTLALLSDGKGVGGVSVDMNISYMNAVSPGQELVIEGYTEKSGRTLAFLTADLKLKHNNKPVAKGTHTKYLAR